MNIPKRILRIVEATPKGDGLEHEGWGRYRPKWGFREECQAIHIARRGDTGIAIAGDGRAMVRAEFPQNDRWNPEKKVYEQSGPDCAITLHSEQVREALKGSQNGKYANPIELLNETRLGERGEFHVMETTRDTWRSGIGWEHKTTPHPVHVRDEFPAWESAIPKGNVLPDIGKGNDPTQIMRFVAGVKTGDAGISVKVNLYRLIDTLTTVARAMGRTRRDKDITGIDLWISPDPDTPIKVTSRLRNETRQITALIMPENKTLPESAVDANGEQTKATA